MHSIIFENEYALILLEQVNNVIRVEYKEGVDYLDMEDEDYKEITNQYTEVINNKQIKEIILDTRHSEFVISEELQQWEANITKNTNLPSLKKIAIAESLDTFSRISRRQSIDILSQFTDVEIKCFENIKKAERWLNLK